MTAPSTTIPTGEPAAGGAAASATLFAAIAASGERSLAYRSLGQGPPLILANRFRGDLDTWDPAFLDALARHFRVITFDYRGFGRSTGAPSTTIGGFAADIVELAAALGFETFALGGWSFGGMAAQVAVAEHPQRVSHAILIGTRPPGAFEHPPSQLFLATAWKPTNDLDDEIVLFFDPTSAASREAARRSHQRIAARTADRDVPVPPELWGFYRQALADYEADPRDARGQLARTEVPILVISAQQEICFPPQNWYAVAGEWRTTQLSIFPQTGHGPQHQHPETISGYIAEFVSRTL